MKDETSIRVAKRIALEDIGMPVYPVDAQRFISCVDVLENFDKWTNDGRELTIQGRIMITRVHGSMLFADLSDATGKIQLVLKENEISANIFSSFRDNVDPGDIIEVIGSLFITKSGEHSIIVKSWRMLSKAVLPLPSKWHGLKDVEARFRQRELDLLSNSEVRTRFVLRSKLVSAMRARLDKDGFLEVETPILHSIPGGASARPFITHHQALGEDLYLRVAPELYLKRLLIGGFEKIYEIGRCFRNEGIDYAHNPEFTILELYWAFAGKERFISFLEDFVTGILRDVLGSLKIKHPEGDLDFSLPWPRKTFRQSIIDACGIDIDRIRTKPEIEKAVRRAGIFVDLEKCVSIGECYDALYKKVARHLMHQPVWIFDYPAEVKPLANVSPDDPTKSATAQLVVHGAEIINAFYYELHDPVIQRKRFEEQQKWREQGSDEAQTMDAAFLRAMEHGMPPASGVGIGVDRLVALFAGVHHIKEVILFPTLRKESED